MAFRAFHKTFQGLPLSRQLLLPWVAWIVVVVALLSGGAALMMDRHLRNELSMRALDEAGSRLELLDIHLRTLEEEVQRLARHSLPESIQKKEVHRALLVDLMLHRETRALFITDTEAHILYASRALENPVPDAVALTLKSGQVMRQLQTGTGTYALIVPIMQDGRIRGTVIALFDFRAILQNFFQRKSGFRYTLEHKGQILFQSAPSLAPDLLDYQTPLMRDLGISCRYEMHDPEYRRPLQDILILLLIISLALIVLTVAISATLARSLSQPLVTMTRTVTAATEGWEAGQTRNEVKNLQLALGLHQTQSSQKMHELEKARDEALKATQTKSEFLANMSHEIRAPMNGVLGMAQLMRFTEMTAEQRKYINAIVDAGDSLMSIINDILDFSKIEAGHFQIDFQDFDLKRCLQNTLQIFEVKAKEKGLDLILEMKDDLPRQMRGDDLRLRQILNNLISNAIKFTAAGRVVVRVLAQPQPEDKYNLSIQVQDTGIGIHKDDLGRLFKSFSQANNSITRKFGGTGLGLAISQALCEMMGGRIGVTSTPGQGSTFFFNLIFEKARSEVPEVKENELDYSRNLRILVAEDSDVNQMIIRTMFKKLGIRVDIASDGVEAIAMAAATAYDLIYMDVHMPNKEGPEAAQIILAANSIQPPPRIIALTADMFKDDHHKCFEAGMIDLLMKPIQLQDLKLSLMKYGHRARSDRKRMEKAS